MASLTKITLPAFLFIFVFLSDNGQASKTIWVEGDFLLDQEGDADEDDSSGETVNGNWANWGQWSRCYKDCGGAEKATRQRNCTDPPPSDRGMPCVGLVADTKLCDKDKIPSQSARIVGGQVTTIQEWPWQVGIKINNSESQIVCGGSLLNRGWILTAAHCVRGFKTGSRDCSDVPENRNLFVVLGKNDLKKHESHEITSRVLKVCLHRRYDNETMDYDIALLRILRPLSNYNQYTSPVCLSNTSHSFPSGTKCLVTGWGATGQSQSSSQKLRVAQVPIINTDECQEQYGRNGSIVTNTMICAGYDQGMIDGCQGDSGSPLVCVQNNRFVLAGVVSWGVGCANRDRPGVYTNVIHPAIRRWIDKVLRRG